MRNSHDTIVVGLGEVLWDCFGENRLPGGAPANVAFHAQQLGHQGIVCSRVGRDSLGRDLIDYLARHGLDTRHIQLDAEHPTGTVTVDASRPDHPTYAIHENVAWDSIEFTDEVRGLMESAAAVCFGSLAQRSPASRDAIGRCLAAARDALIVFDVNLRQSWYDRPTIEESLARCDIAKLNADEARTLAGLLGTASPDPRRFAQEILARYDLQMVCITRAERGCLLVTRTDVADAPGRPVQVVDTVGSGDAFSAALISARLEGWPLAATAVFANAVGALVATRPGAMPHLRDEYAALKADTLRALSGMVNKPPES